MASGITRTAMRDEELARRLQTEEFSDGDSNITLRQRLAKLKMENLKTSLLQNTNRLSNITSSRSRDDDNNDSVIIIDDDSDDAYEVRSSPVITRPTPNDFPRSRSNLTRSRTLNMSPALENRNRISTEEDMIKADELLARKIQADLDKEFRESQRVLSTQLASPVRRIHPRYIQVTDSQTSDRHNESLGEVLRRFTNSSSSDNLRQDNASPIRRTIPVAFEQNILNLVSQNINSNELRPTERNLRSSDINRLINRSSHQDPIDINSSLSSRNTNMFPTHPPRHQHHRSNLNLQYSINPFMNRLPIYPNGLHNRFSVRSLNLGIDNLLEDNDNDNYEVLLRLDERNIKTRLNKEEIDSLSRFSYKTIKDSESDTTCSICFDEYESKSVLTALVCSHKFHSSCIKKWLNQSRRCPLCQKDAIKGT